MNIKYPTVLILSTLLLFSNTHASLLQPVDTGEDFETDSNNDLNSFNDPIIGNLSYANFGSIWQDEVELYTLESDNESRTFLCDRNVGNCLEGSFEDKPTGKISYDGRLVIDDVATNEDLVIKKVITLDDDFLLPVSAESRTSISRDGSTIIVQNEQTIHVIDVATKDFTMLDATNFTASEYYFVSPSGNLISAYDSESEFFQIFDLVQNQIIEIEAECGSYFEISPDGNYGAFITVKNNHDELTLVNLSNLATLGTSTTTNDFDATDYIFSNNYLFYVTNEDEPYVYTLKRLDLDTMEIDVITENIVSNGYLRLVDNQLVFRVKTGLGSELKTLDSNSSSLDSFIALKTNENTLADRLSYTTFDINSGDSFNGILLEENNVDGDDRLPLVIWLHGGPQRQALPGIHDSRTYGIFDQMLENLVLEADGVRVLKLDFPGSTGFGFNYTDSLLDNIGESDVEAVKEAIEAITDEYRTADVHVTGISYGGYLAIKAGVELPNEIDNIVSIAGVSDWEANDVRDDGGFSFTMRLDENEREEQYQQSSILDRLDELDDKTKLGLVVGLEDTVVLPQQSYDVIDTIEDENIDLDEVILLEFENEGHVPMMADSLNQIYQLWVDLFAKDN